jgi:hypothetical protein
MSEVISFRLDPKNPREAEALKVLARRQEQGDSVRHILTEALLKLDRADVEVDIQTQMGEILSAIHRVGNQIEHLQKSGVQHRGSPSEKQVGLSNAFLLSVKSAAKPGITLES